MNKLFVFLFSKFRKFDLKVYLIATQCIIWNINHISITLKSVNHSQCQSTATSDSWHCMDFSMYPVQTNYFILLVFHSASVYVNKFQFQKRKNKFGRLIFYKTERTPRIFHELWILKRQFSASSSVSIWVLIPIDFELKILYHTHSLSSCRYNHQRTARCISKNKRILPKQSEQK